MIVDFQHCKSHQSMMQSQLPITSQVQLDSVTKVKTNNRVGISQQRQTQLQFNRNIATLPSNLAVLYSSPNPIVIEKLKQSHDRTREAVEEDGRLTNSSTPFAVVSEERLNLAIQLAKRDVKRKNLEIKVNERFANDNQNKLFHKEKSDNKEKETSENAAARNRSKTYVHIKRGQHSNQPVKSEITSSGAKLFVYTPNFDSVRHDILDSPPTHDSGPGPKKSPSHEDKSAQEVRRLQKELSKYIRKIEELARKDRSGGFLDPDEERRGQIKRQEQSARSARMLYVLQQQVKEIQEDLEELSPRKIKHTKKQDTALGMVEWFKMRILGTRYTLVAYLQSRTMSRLAAVHRGAIRALQMFVAQFTEQTENRVPAHYKELGHLIRQLSLCSAKLEEKADSSLSETIISILQQVEDLDSLMERKQTPLKMKKSSRLRSKSSSSREVSPDRPRSPSPWKVKKSSPVSKERVVLAHKRLPVVRKLLTDDNRATTGLQVAQEQAAGTQVELHKEHIDEIPNLNKNSILKEGIAELAHELHFKIKPTPETAPFKSKGVLLPERPQGFRKPRKMGPTQPPSKHAHFQEKTLAFKLKETQAPIREGNTPWIPPHPTSPPASPKRVNQVKKNDSSKEVGGRDQIVLPMRRDDKKLATAEEEAIRLAWLDSVTARTMRELNLLRSEEMNRLKSFRSDTRDHSRLAAGDHTDLQTGKHQAAAVIADQLSKKFLDEVLEDTTQGLWDMERSESLLSESIGLQDSSSLEIMMQRMEEMERSQDSVRRRFNQIVYSDPEFWAKEQQEDRETASLDRKPVSPRPIRITRILGHKDPEVDIILEEPINATDGSIELEEKSETSNLIPPVTQKVSWQSQGSKFLSVPRQMLQRVRDYKDRYEQHLKLISHETVGSFNPWHITESIAEELLEDALVEVAAELQDLCEDFAEAVFTSEFLQPVK